MTRTVHIARQLSGDFAMELLRGSDDGRMTVYLAEWATAWNPASTKDERRLIGPAVIDYTLHPDGGVDAVVRDPEPVGPVRQARKAKPQHIDNYGNRR